jgi:plastocyanin
MRCTRRFAALSGLLLVTTIASTCGGSSPSSPSPSPGSGNGGNTLVFTVTAAGVSPRTLAVPNGSRIRFVNNDTRPHDMTSNPHPTHEDCPELNQIGFLNPGQQRESGNLVTTRVCGFHDHDNPGTLTLQGSVTIQ